MMLFQIASILVFFLGAPSAVYANEADVPSYAGLWHFHSSGGYKGYIALDGQGGCSYFMSSAVLTIQATCIAREMAGGGLIIFGTQEGSSSTAPEYGEQLGAAAARPPSTTVTFQVSNIQSKTMAGKLITPGAEEDVRFSQ